MSGGRGTFDGQHWREELLRKRTKEALERYPAGERRLLDDPMQGVLQRFVRMLPSHHCTPF